MTARPFRVTPDGGWQQVRATWRERGIVVVYGSVPDWLPPQADQERLLTRGDAERWERLRGGGQRRRFLSSRLLLRSAVGRLTGESWQVVETSSTSLGRPLVPGHPALRLSLSHTAALLVVAVSRRGPVGVDAEPVERSAAGAEQRICLPEELRALPPGPGGRRERQLLRLWTLKEAYTKALGQGLRIPARSFGFGLGTDEAFLLDAPVRAPGTGGWSFVTHTVRTGLPAPHLISVAVGQDGDLPPPPTVAPSGRLS